MAERFPYLITLFLLLFSHQPQTAFTSEQLLELEREFHAKKYLSLTERSQIATTLKLSEVQVGDLLWIFNSHVDLFDFQILSRL